MDVHSQGNIDGDTLIELVERNLGSRKPDVILIVDINFKVWGKKGEISNDILEFYQKFPFTEMDTGDTVHNKNTYMMKITQKMAVLVGMEDSHLARLSAINLKGRINALSSFKNLEEYVKEKKLAHELLKLDLETGGPYYQALYTYDALKNREKSSFILDRTILQVVCEAGTISLSQLRQEIAAFEELLGERIDLEQIRSICDRYIREGLIKQLKGGN